MPNYVAAARRAARRAGIDPNVFQRQIQQESGFNPGAVSPAGAVGIAQIMPATASGWGVNPRDPMAALGAAAQHMAQYARQYGGMRNALIAYNAGPGAVGRASLPAETQDYVSKILGSAGTPATFSPGGDTGVNAPSTNPRLEAAFRANQKILNAPIQRINIPGVETIGQPSPMLQRLQNETSNLVAKNSEAVRQLRSGVVGGRVGDVGNPVAVGEAKDLLTRANMIDAAQQPYKWGGGHGATPTLAGPWDCSGAVSAVLGVDPRVSGAFQSWGAPGGGRHVTIYANPTHVLMEIDGHFFGTSQTNPGGGAGWIPRSAISPQYLARFTARHPVGM